jgi:hypothetical protein
MEMKKSHFNFNCASLHGSVRAGSTVCVLAAHSAGPRGGGCGTSLRALRCVAVWLRRATLRAQWTALCRVAARTGPGAAGHGMEHVVHGRPSWCMPDGDTRLRLYGAQGAHRLYGAHGAHRLYGAHGAHRLYGAHVDGDTRNRYMVGHHGACPGLVQALPVATRLLVGRDAPRSSTVMTTHGL